MVFHGFWLVSMVFQVGFMVFHGFCLVLMVFQVGFMPESILIYFEGLDARIQFDWFDVMIYFPSF